MCGPVVTEPAPATPGVITDWPAEVARLGKVVRALMDRAERSTRAQGSDYNQFQAGVMLEE